MSKHINFLLQIVEIMVSEGAPETREGCGGYDTGHALHYEGTITFNGEEYKARYYTGRSDNGLGYSTNPYVELYNDNQIAYRFDSTEKTPISIAMHRAFAETFTKTKPE